MEAIQLSQEFQWPFGPKKVFLHSSHVGLKGQWRTINSETPDDVISVVLEDDIVVSPYFFLWMTRAVNSYYTSQQIELHRDLLEAVRADVFENERAENSPETLPTTFHVDQFYRNQAGRGVPVMLGLTLAKQYSDIVHYPAELEIRNHNAPYLLKSRSLSLPFPTFPPYL